MNAAMRTYTLIFLAISSWPRTARGADADLSQIPCACATVVDSQIPGPLAGGGGQILANLGKSGSFTKAGYDLGKFHECQHNIGGADEQQADEQGAELACKAGMLTEEAVQNICAILVNSRSSTGKHPPGPQRCQTFKTALQNCKKGGGSGGAGGSGGGNSCGGGQPFQSPQMPAGGPQQQQQGSSGKTQPGLGNSSITRQDPEDSNPFKTGNYVQEAARIEASDGWPEVSVPNQKSPKASSDITKSSPTAPLPSDKADRVGFETSRRAASARVGSESLSGNTAKAAQPGVDGSPPPGVTPALNPTRPTESATGSAAPPKTANAEVPEAYSKPLSSPVISLNNGEFASALKDFVPAPEPVPGDGGQSLFERCHVAHRKAQISGNVR